MGKHRRRKRRMTLGGGGSGGEVPPTAAAPSLSGAFRAADGGLAHGTDYAPSARDRVQRIDLSAGGLVWWARPASYLAIGLLAWGLIWLLRPVLTPIAAAFAAAYLVSPVVDGLEARGIPRSVSILTILLLITSAIAGAIAVLIPLVQDELRRLLDNAPGYWEQARQWLDGTLRPFVEARLGWTLPSSPQDFWDQAGARLSGSAPDLASGIADLAKGTIANAFGVFAALLSLLLFPVFFFYILKDFNRIKDAAEELIPPRSRALVLARLRQVDRVIAAFVRGQLTVCMFLAVAYSVGLSFTGIDLAVVIGVASGFAFVIPYAGTIVGVAAGSIMAIAKFGVIDPDFVLRIEPRLLGVWGVFGVVQLLESNVVTPKIVGEQVGLHPVVMITAVIVGGQLFGFLGVLLAVPVTAAAAVFWWAGWERYKRSDFYLARR